MILDIFFKQIKVFVDTASVLTWRAREGKSTETVQEMSAALSRLFETLVEKCEVPINMVLHCPNCHVQHVDAPDEGLGWKNPPHRTHQCGQCGALWRPSHACTNGVQELPVPLTPQGNEGPETRAKAYTDFFGEKD